MKVMGIDPGFGRCGVAILEDGKTQNSNGKTDILLYSTCIETDKALSFPRRLGDLVVELQALVIKWQPERAAIEKLFFSKNVKTAMQVAETRGMIIALAQNMGLVVEEYSPQAIKVALTGVGTADKTQVARMVERLVAMNKTPKHDDEYDAIAIAITDIHSLHI
ncbi:MAG TPA: crossover junction endodeoxyribonuclease RuvC [Candidatus Paceibacterota bacterium]